MLSLIWAGINDKISRKNYLKKIIYLFYIFSVIKEERGSFIWYIKIFKYGWIKFSNKRLNIIDKRIKIIFCSNYWRLQLLITYIGQNKLTHIAYVITPQRMWTYFMFITCRAKLINLYVINIILLEWYTNNEIIQKYSFRSS